MKDVLDKQIKFLQESCNRRFKDRNGNPEVFVTFDDCSLYSDCREAEVTPEQASILALHFPRMRVVVAGLLDGEPSLEEVTRKMLKK